MSRPDGHAHLLDGRRTWICMSIALMFLLGSLAGCGTVTGTQSLTASRASTGTPPPLVPAFNNAVAADMQTMHLQFTGMHCQGEMILRDAAHLEFDQTTLVKLHAYAGAFNAGWSRAAVDGYVYAP